MNTSGQKASFCSTKLPQRRHSARDPAASSARRNTAALEEVLPEHQGSGVGTSILKWVLRHAARLGLHVGLQVHKGNPRALSLYRGIGFTIIGETATHYRMRSADKPMGSVSSAVRVGGA